VDPLAGVMRLRPVWLCPAKQRCADMVPSALLTALEIAAGVVAAVVFLAYLFGPWR